MRWQLLWILGLWFGTLGLGRTREAIASGGSVLTSALAISCDLLFWRHFSGPMVFADTARHLVWIDKWWLSPVRVVNLGALVYVFMALGPDLLKRPVFRPWKPWSALHNGCSSCI